MHMTVSSRSPPGSGLQRGRNHSTEQLTPVLAWPLPRDGRSRVSLLLRLHIVHWQNRKDGPPCWEAAGRFKTVLPGQLSSTGAAE